MTEAEIERFWAKVEKRGPDECWLWKASFAGKGYGQFRLPGTRRNVYAHRLAFELSAGRELPKGKHVAHRCDTPACCNPAHLFEATPAENARDMVQKGRSTRGERNPQAKLRTEQVAEIRRLYAQGIAQWRVAQQFGVAQATVSKIVCGYRWAGSSEQRPSLPRGDLSEAWVAQIRAASAAGLPQWRIALAFSVTQSTVSRILNGKRHRRET